MPKASAPDLLERLREVYRDADGNTLSDEKLAGKLPISLSTFNRWKKGDTKAFRDTIAMLDTAGWLNIDADAPRAESPPDLLADIADGVAEILLRLPEPRAKQKPRRAAVPKRPATGR